MSQFNSRGKIKRDHEAEKWDLNRAFKETIKKVLKLEERDSDRKICDLFLSLPSKKEYSDYYKEIEKPISINCIQKKVKDKSYPDWSSFYLDWCLLTDNAKQYNIPESEVYEDAVIIMKYLRRISISIKHSPYMQGFDIDKFESIHKKDFKEVFEYNDVVSIKPQKDIQKDSHKEEPKLILKLVPQPKQDPKPELEPEQEIENEPTGVQVDFDLVQVYEAKWKVIKKYFRITSVINEEILNKQFVCHDTMLKLNLNKNYDNLNINRIIPTTINEIEVMINPVQCACFFGRIKGLIFLFAFNPDFSIRDPTFNLNILEWAALGGCPRVCYYLVNYTELDLKSRELMNNNGLNFNKLDSFEKWRKSTLKDHYIPLDASKFEEGSVIRYLPRFKKDISEIVQNKSHDNSFVEVKEIKKETKKEIKNNINQNGSESESDEEEIIESEEEEADNNNYYKMIQNINKMINDNDLYNKINDSSLDKKRLLDAKLELVKNVNKLLEKTANINSNNLEKQKQNPILLDLLLFHLLSFKEDNNQAPLCTPLLFLPDKQKDSGYYNLIKSPICLEMIKNRVKANRCIGDLDKNIELLIYNTKLYYDENHINFIVCDKLELVYRYLRKHFLSLNLTNELKMTKQKNSLLTLYYNNELYCLGDVVIIDDSVSGGECLLTVQSINVKKNLEIYFYGTKLVMKGTVLKDVNDYIPDDQEVFRCYSKISAPLSSIKRKCCVLYIKKYKCYYPENFDSKDVFFFEFSYFPDEQIKLKQSVDKSKFISTHPYLPHKLIERKTIVEPIRPNYAKSFNCNHNHLKKLNDNKTQSAVVNAIVYNPDLVNQLFLNHNNTPYQQQRSFSSGSNSLISNNEDNQNINFNLNNNNNSVNINNDINGISSSLIHNYDYIDTSINKKTKLDHEFNNEEMIENINIDVKDIQVSLPLKIIQELIIISFQLQSSPNGIQYISSMKYHTLIEEPTFSFRVGKPTSFIYIAINLNPNIPTALLPLLKANLMFEDLTIKNNIPSDLKQKLSNDLPYINPWKEWVLKVGNELGIVNLNVGFINNNAINQLHLNDNNNQLFNHLEIVTLQEV